MDVPEGNLFAMKRHNMQSVERGGGKVGYMTELVELRFMSVRIRRSQFFHKSCYVRVLLRQNCRNSLQFRISSPVGKRQASES
jgi:hypothetical protein